MTPLSELPNIISDLRKINGKQIYVGVPTGNNFLTMVALVQQQGKHIRAKNYPYLWIPTSNAKGRKPGQIPGLYVRKHSAGVDDPTQNNGWKICFVLRKEVTIPARPFITFTKNHNERLWSDLYIMNLKKVMNQDINVDKFFQILGERMQHDMQKVIREYSRPANAPLTAERKGFNNPLTDTGRLEKSITWFIANKNK